MKFTLWASAFIVAFEALMIPMAIMDKVFWVAGLYAFCLFVALGVAFHVLWNQYLIVGYKEEEEEEEEATN